MPAVLLPMLPSDSAGRDARPTADTVLRFSSRFKPPQPSKNICSMQVMILKRKRYGTEI
ncbi:hypothetical protein l11_18760 [Neisseria weaveri LMG 5135]|nr:hypothetical protein l11_18760 [Neisseria weaveri LMG 5135]